MINIKDDADGMAQLIDSEGETLVLECGLLGKFRKMDATEPITQVVLFTTHPTHYLIARRHSGMREASENGFDVLCFSKARFSAERFQVVARRFLNESGQDIREMEGFGNEPPMS